MNKHTLPYRAAFFCMGALVGLSPLGCGRSANDDHTNAELQETQNRVAADSDPNNRDASDNLPSGTADVVVPAEPVRIPFQLTDANNISVPVEINGRMTSLMFHTAVDSIYLTRDAVENIPNRVKAGALELKSWGGSAQAELLVDNTVRIGKLEWPKQSILVDSFSGPGTDGKFGPALFGSKVIEISFDRRELVIHSEVPKFVSADSSPYRRLNYRLDRGSMFIEGDVGLGEMKFSHSWMLHSGFGGTMILDDDFVAAHPLLEQLPVIRQRELKDSLGNIIKTKTVVLDFIEIAGVRFSDVPVEIFDSELGMQKTSVLGGELMKQINMVVDTVHQHLYVIPSNLHASTQK